MRTYEVEFETIDRDVCLGDYDGTVREEFWYLKLFEDGVKIDGMGLCTQNGAEETGKIFLDGGLSAVYKIRYPDSPELWID
jgi:hypothetical protein